MSKKFLFSSAIIALTLICFMWFVLAVAPNFPSSPNYPLNGSTGIELNPTLNVTVTDPDSATLNVSFYEYIPEENWTMFLENVNHTGYTTNHYPDNISTVYATFTTSAWGIGSSPAVANGYVYIGAYDYNVYQLNASNISQKIANFTTGDSIRGCSPAVANGYVYIGGDDDNLYQLNASNVSQKIANFTTGDNIRGSSPAVANGYVYFGSHDNNVYQLNASNISQQIANFTTGGSLESSPAVANGYVYIGSPDNNLYQLNASNISQKIANFTTGSAVYSSPSISGDYVYIGTWDSKLYQLNASNVSQEIASFTTDSEIWASSTIGNGYVYIGDQGGKIYQLNASNISQEIAEFVAGTDCVDATPTVTEKYIYFGSYDKIFYQLNASNISQQISNYTVYGDYVRSSPAIANGYVYTADDWDGSCCGIVYQLGEGGLIGQDTNAENNSYATYQWSDLSEETTYEWYVTVDDGIGINTSSTWNFTTGTPPQIVDTAVTEEEPSTGGGGGGYPTFKPSQEQMEEGYEKSLRKNWKIQLDFDNKTHIIKLDNIINKTATITVSSESVTFNLSINETKKFNLNDDNYYDLEIFLKDIKEYYNEADLILKFIHEEILGEEEEKLPEEKIKEGNFVWLVALFILAIAVMSINKIKSKKKK